MADRYVRIGSLEDGFGYDNVDFPESIKVDDPIKITSLATASDHAITLGEVEALIIPTTLGIVGRNMVIGGNFSTNPWQRGTTFTSVGLVSTADLFKISYNLGTGVVDVLKTADGYVSSGGQYGSHCLHVDVTTAEAAIAAGEYFLIRTTVEGLIAAPAGFGVSGTRYITISFDVKATKTGINCLSIRNRAQDRSYVAEYTINAADTWEHKTITIPVDTSGIWRYDTDAGFYLSWALAAGSTYHATVNTWSAGNLIATASQVNNLDSTSNNFKINFVSCVLGQSELQFENLAPQHVRTLCNRYLRYLSFTNGQIRSTTSGMAQSTSTGWFCIPGEMRALPAISYTGTLATLDGNTASNISGITPYSNDNTGVTFYTTTAATQTAGDALVLYANGTSCTLVLSAEL